MNIDLIRQIIDDGQRNYRLRELISYCPKFEDPIYINAWKAGYYSARDKISLDVALITFISEINKVSVDPFGIELIENLNA